MSAWFSRGAHRRIGNPITVPVGAASLEVHRRATAEALVMMAHRALCAAKDRGKNRIVTFTGTLIWAGAAPWARAGGPHLVNRSQSQRNPTAGLFLAIMHLDGSPAWP